MVMENLAMPAAAENAPAMLDILNQNASDAGCDLKLAVFSSDYAGSPRGKQCRKPPSGPPSAYGRPSMPNLKPHTPVNAHTLGFGGGNAPPSADAF